MRRRSLTGWPGRAGGRIASTSPASMPWTRTRLPTSTPPTSGRPATTGKLSPPHPAPPPTTKGPPPASKTAPTTTRPSTAACQRDKDRDTRALRKKVVGDPRTERSWFGSSHYTVGLGARGKIGGHPLAVPARLFQYHFFQIGLERRRSAAGPLNCGSLLRPWRRG